MVDLSLTPALLPGDRLPNFQRHDADDRPVVFYDVYCGRPVLLVIVLDPQTGSLAGAINAAREADVSVIWMIDGTPTDAARFRDEFSPPGQVIADDGQIIDFLFGGTRPDSALVTFSLDANARIIGRWLDWSDSALASWPADDPGRLVTRTAPVLVIPRVFEPDFCRHLIDVYQSDNEPSGVLKLVEGRMVYQTDDDTKIRREHRIEETGLRQAVEKRLLRRVLPEIEWAFNFKVTRYEAFKIVCYDASTGGHFRAHRDNNGVDTAHRRFALTLNLNSDDYSGGELRFPEYGPDRYKPPTGGAVVFSCSLAHEALRVEQGARYALVSFFYGDRDHHQQVQYENRVRA
ncbi:MAG: 2OG-Fe(II) oxygenase [Xanthomonadales bacterium]|nr:2OG-Fe(II) oxygenase [Xanthomonadales bacterium]